MISTYEKANRGKLLAVVAILAMVLCAFAALAPTAETDAANGSVTYISGTITSAQQDFGDDTAVVVNDDLTIPEGMHLTTSGNFTVNSGVTLTVENGAELTFTSNAAGDNKIVIDGNIVASGYTEGKTAVTNSTTITLNGSITLEKGAVMEGDGTIVMKSTSTIDITKRSSSISQMTGQTIQMYEGAIFNLDGRADVTIEAVSDVKYATLGSISIGMADEYEDNSRDSSKLTVTITSAATQAFAKYQTDDSKVTVRQYSVNVDGTVSAGDTLTFLAAKDKALDGLFGYYEVDGNVAGSDKIVNANTVTGNLTIDGNGNVVFAAGSYTTISGTATAKFNEGKGTEGEAGYVAPTTDQIAIAGTVTVSGTVSFTWKAVDKDVSGGTLIVDGGNVDITGDVFGNTDYVSDPQIHVYGAIYQVDGTNAFMTYIRDFTQATVDAAVAAEADEIIVYGLTSQSPASNIPTSDDARDAGAYIVDSNITIPENMTLVIGGLMVVNEDVALTFAEGSEAIIAQNWDLRIYVDGKVIDQDGFLEGDANNYLVYQVEKLSEDELVTTYTTLAIALAEAVDGEVIGLNGAITIDEDLTIPANVTVVTDEDVVTAITLVGSKLTVNGTLQIAGQDKNVVLKDNADGDKASIVINNMIKNADDETFVDDNNNKVTVAGAVLYAELGDDTTAQNYYTSVAVAAANSAAAEADIQVYGDVTFGDVTFTSGEDYELEVVINGTKVSAGTITLVGAGIQIPGTMTGTVAIDATAGAVSIDLNKVSGIAVVAVETDDGETITSTVEMSQIADYVSGSVTIATGSVIISGTMVFGNVVDTDASYAYTTGIIDVATGATLVIGSDANVTVYVDFDAKVNENMTIEEAIEAVAGMDVAGTLTVNGKLTAFIATVSGTMDVAEGSEVHIFGCIDGTVNTAKDSDVYFDGIVNGVISGEVTIETVVAYPGADMSAAVMNPDINGETDVDSTVFYLNGVEVATVYVANDLNEVITDIINYLDTTALVVASAEYYSDAGLTLEIRNPDNAYVGEYETVYITMKAAYAYGTISAGTGLDLYIDSVKTASGSELPLTVGTHTVSFDVKAGYDGSDAAITFNGQTIQNGGTITVTADMIKDGFTLVATGAVPSQGQVVIDEGSDSGMGITDYLLIILVILVIVLAVFVAMRMMRS